jgi:hypothetical protein
MSVIMDYEPFQDWTMFKLVCPKCGHDRFDPYFRKSKCMRAVCGLCSQNVIKPQLRGDDFIECIDCGLKSECIGLPTFKIYDFIVHG